MSKVKRTYRLLAVLLSLILAGGGVPAFAFAQNPSESPAPPSPVSSARISGELDAQDAASGPFSSLAGSGTQTDPYQLSSPADFATLHAAVNDQGLDCADLFFKQTADVTLPAVASGKWTPIGCRIDPSIPNIGKGSNMRAFGGTYDGGGRTLTVPKGSGPLFGYVKGATIRNLNIYGEQIAGYGLIDNMEGNGLSGSAVTVEGVTLKAGTKTLKAGILGCALTASTFAGVSVDYISTIRDCSVEAGVEIGYDGTQSQIGSIAGRFNGTITNCTSAARVKGRDFVGGIVGSRDNAMGTYEVTGCTFRGVVEARGEYVGGIAGGNYDNVTAPNGKKPTIKNCTVSGSVTGADKVGGILGGDRYGIQAWNDARIANNSVKGELSAENEVAVGGIVGYYANLNKHDIIKNNCFKGGCGAQAAFGKVISVDTSNATYAGAPATPYGADDHGR